MKSKKLSYIVLILVVLLAFSACVNSNSGNLGKAVEFGSNAANIMINTRSPESISFNIALLSNKKISKVSYIGLEGTNVNNEDFQVEIIDNNSGKMNNYKYNRMFIKYIMIEILPNKAVSNCEFDNIILNVDGTRRDISFNTPIKHEFSEGNVFTESLRISVIPNEFSSNMINNTSQIATYEFEATEDVTINNIYFTDFLKPTEITMAIDDAESQNASFPKNINKGQVVKIGIAFSSQDATKESYIATNLFFDYTTISDKLSHYNSFVVVFDPIYPLDDNDNSNIDRLIDSINLG